MTNKLTDTVWENFTSKLESQPLKRNIYERVQMKLTSTAHCSRSTSEL